MAEGLTLVTSPDTSPVTSPKTGVNQWAAKSSSGCGSQLKVTYTGSKGLTPPESPSGKTLSVASTLTGSNPPTTSTNPRETSAAEINTLASKTTPISQNQTTSAATTAKNINVSVRSSHLPASTGHNALASKQPPQSSYTEADMRDFEVVLAPNPHKQTKSTPVTTNPRDGLRRGSTPEKSAAPKQGTYTNPSNGLRRTSTPAQPAKTQHTSKKSFKPTLASVEENGAAEALDEHAMIETLTRLYNPLIVDTNDSTSVDECLRKANIDEMRDSIILLENRGKNCIGLACLSRSSTVDAMCLTLRQTKYSEEVRNITDIAEITRTIESITKRKGFDSPEGQYYVQVTTYSERDGERSPSPAAPSATNTGAVSSAKAQTASENESTTLLGINLHNAQHSPPNSAFDALRGS